MKTIPVILSSLFLMIAPFCEIVSAQTNVLFSGGYETNPADHGRPVILIASALGVPDTVFRDSFSRVRPARAGEEPDPEQVKRNKEALLTTLAPYGVTNDTLDKVSNYYRYAESKGEVWKRRPAKAIAMVVNNKITGFKIIDGGAGYTTVPTVSVHGLDIKIKATISFGKDLNTNGSVTELTVVK